MVNTRIYLPLTCKLARPSAWTNRQNTCESLCICSLRRSRKTLFILAIPVLPQADYPLSLSRQYQLNPGVLDEYAHVDGCANFSNGDREKALYSLRVPISLRRYLFPIHPFPPTLMGNRRFEKRSILKFSSTLFRP